MKGDWIKRFSVLLISGIMAFEAVACSAPGKEETAVIEVSENKLTLAVGETAVIEIDNYEDLRKLDCEIEDEDVIEIEESEDGEYTVTGLAEGKTTVTFRAKDAEEVTVKITVEAGEEAAEAEEENIAKQTIMIYMIGSDLESKKGGLATKDLDEIRKTSITEDTNIILQTGGCSNWQNSYCRADTVQRFSYRDGSYTELSDLGKISMADPGTLQDFIVYAAENYPAEDYVLLLWDHGGGIPVCYGVDEMFPNDCLEFYEIGDAIAGSGIHFDSVIFDCCLMCTLEVGMALKDNVDYMIGAESIVNGTGLSYTNWIDMLATSPVSDGKYRTQVASDYIASCTEKGWQATMSVVSLDRIEGVYDSYTDYIASLKSELEKGGYAQLVQARNDCMSFSTDTVDLMTLAGKYETDGSTALMNAITNAVDYTESTYSMNKAQGRGICAYFPNDRMDCYTSGRNGFQMLRYNSTIMDFYDEYMSVCYGFAYGAVEAEENAGDWYRQGIIDTYVASGILTGPAQEYYLAYSSAVYDDGVERYYLETGGIKDILEVSVFLAYGEDFDGDGTNDLSYLGFFSVEDQFDSAGDLLITVPEKWPCINDYPIYVKLMKRDIDTETGYWSQYGYTYQIVNGEICTIYLKFDRENPDGVIIAYSQGKISDDDNDTILTFEKDDEIQIIQYRSGFDIYEVGDPIRYSELNYHMGELNKSVMICSYTVEDVYGNKYESDAAIFKDGKLIGILAEDGTGIVID